MFGVFHVHSLVRLKKKSPKKKPSSTTMGRGGGGGEEKKKYIRRETKQENWSGDLMRSALHVWFVPWTKVFFGVPC